MSEERDDDGGQASSDEDDDLGDEGEDDDEEEDDADSSDNGGEGEESSGSEGDNSSGDENEDEGEEDDDEEEEGDASGSGHRRRKEQRRGSKPRRSDYEILKGDENLKGPEELPNTKPMMELDAGSNIWYQAYVLKESINEAKVRFPDPDGGRRDLLRAWVNKASSRIWRGSYAHGDWQFLGKGAWKPREKPRRGGGGRSSRRAATVSNPRKNGGAARATRSDGGAAGHQRKLARGSHRADDEESDADSGQSEGSEDEEEVPKEGLAATSSDASLAEESRLKRAKQHHKDGLARQTVSAPQPANGRPQQLLHHQQQQQHRQGLGVQKAGTAGDHPQTDIEDCHHNNRRQQQQQRTDKHAKAQKLAPEGGGGSRGAAPAPAPKGVKPAVAARQRDRDDGNSGWGRGNDEAAGDDDDDAASAKSARGDLQEAHMAAAAAVAHALEERLHSSQQLPDPLAHWFEVHYSLLARSRRLWPNSRNSVGNLESGKLPAGDARSWSLLFVPFEDVRT
eukprot:gene5535-5771_t